ncbi:transglutaminase-like domain-containing protein [Dactylosporangium sp. McL0621]|uniref:transglutaminase-like domain-containing protein n=1 Tax=Dactylosporangium sp. McL0621 TaxID=3415678 RepID=UPI003CED6259
MDEVEFSLQQSAITDPGRPLTGLPAGVADLAKVVGGVLVHRDWAPHPVRREDADLRFVAAMLDRLGSLDERPSERRLAVTCRDFTVLLVALLRAGGVPARARAGFAGYFAEGFYDDHWVVETWAEGRGWHLVDAQVASGEPGVYGTKDLDPLDVPRDAFLVGGQAWMECRSGVRDPRTVGTSAAGLTGFWEIQGNVVRDLSALNGVEVLPWDAWGLIPVHFDELPQADVALLDAVAPVSAAGGPLRVAQETAGLDPRLPAPPELSRPPA